MPQKPIDHPQPSNRVNKRCTRKVDGSTQGNGRTACTSVPASYIRTILCARRKKEMILRATSVTVDACRKKETM
jgi:hypothetical protein